MEFGLQELVLLLTLAFLMPIPSIISKVQAEQYIYKAM